MLPLSSSRSVSIAPILAALAACTLFGGHAGTPRDDTPSPSLAPGARPASDLAGAYREAGLIIANGLFPFVGSVHYLASRTRDSTLALVTLSFAGQSLSFANDGTVQHARYDVVLEARRASRVIARTVNRETVRVESPRKAVRPDARIVFQRYLALPPGATTLAIDIRDASGTNATTTATRLTVPRLGVGTLAPPLFAYTASPRASLDSLPHLVANPRDEFVFGRDSVATLYLEGYGLPDSARLVTTVLDEHNRAVQRDTILIGGTGTVSAAAPQLPLARLGPGRFTVAITAPGVADTVHTPLLMTFGEGIGVVPFDSMLSYLRYFTSPARLAELRGAKPGERSTAWRRFLATVQPDSARTTRDELREYFGRIDLANERFRDAGEPGWLTDRGRVAVTLGEPDDVNEQPDSDTGSPSRTLIWTYERYHVRFTFVNATGSGPWRLSPASNLDFERIAGDTRSR